MRGSKASVLAIIPARAGSKGLPGKNLRAIYGKPLIQWTIEAALGAVCVRRTIVSTEDEDIAQAALAAGAEVPFRRPGHLATDTSTTADVVAHAISKCPGFNTIVVLQPTSPLRTSVDIDAAFAVMEEAGTTSCVSIQDVLDPPWLMFRRDPNGILKRLLPEPEAGLRRQDLPSTYSLNGAIYFVSTKEFSKTKSLLSHDTMGFIMPRERSIDIDTLDDFTAVEKILAAEKPLSC